MTRRDSDRETAAIARITRHLPPVPPQVEVEIGDDAAVVRTGTRTILTKDAVVQGPHFRPGWLSMADVGYKAAVSAVSDVFAMGGDPTWVTVAVIAPEDTPPSAFDELGRGLADASRELDVTVVGGDVARGPAFSLVVSVLGNLSDEPFRLETARAGDDLVVTRPLGEMAAALHLLTHGLDQDLDIPESEMLLARFRRPRVSRRGSRELRRVGVHAVTDISDGLLREARRLASAGGVDVHLQRDVPLSIAARAMLEACGLDPAAAALQSGEEYALLAAIPGWSGIRAVPVQQRSWRRAGQVHVSRGEPTARWEDTGEIIDELEAYRHFV
jgi:thiamine-monophosphate kinase